MRESILVPLCLLAACAAGQKPIVETTPKAPAPAPAPAPVQLSEALRGRLPPVSSALAARIGLSLRPSEDRLDCRGLRCQGTNLFPAPGEQSAEAWCEQRAAICREIPAAQVDARSFGPAGAWCDVLVSSGRELVRCKPLEAPVLPPEQLTAALASRLEEAVAREQRPPIRQEVAVYFDTGFDGEVSCLQRVLPGDPSCMPCISESLTCHVARWCETVERIGAAAAADLSFDAVAGSVRCLVSADLGAAPSVSCKVTQEAAGGIGLGSIR